MASDSETFDQEMREFVERFKSLVPRKPLLHFEGYVKAGEYEAAKGVLEGDLARQACFTLQAIRSVDASARTNHSFGKGARQKLRNYLPYAEAVEDFKAFLHRNRTIVCQRQREQYTMAIR